MSVGLDLTGGEPGGLLRAMGARTLNTLPALRRIATLMRQRERTVFRTADGGAWDPLDPDTISAKGSGRILVDTGDLLASLTVRGARYAVTTTAEGTLFFGTVNPVAHLHQRGARGMPRRDPVPRVRPEEVSAWADELIGHIGGQR